MSRPTIKYPRGKLNANDEGQLAIRMFVKGNTLILDFGKSIKWIGLGLHEVTELRRKLGEYEEQLKGVSA